jgi:protein-S-isoprenylcysteine O-methyltransferase Ste14
MLFVMIKLDGDVGTGSSLTLVNSLNEKYKITNVITINNVPRELDVFRSIPLGLLLIVITLVILYFSLREFTKVNEDPVPTSPSNLIITNSIYAYSRNPMYLGLLILQIGLGMLLSVIHITFFALFTYLVLKYYVIIPEEKYLEEKFSEEYLSYKISVRRWF